MENEFDYDYLFKLIIVGNKATGKTSLFNRYLSNKFTNHYKGTMGV